MLTPWSNCNGMSLDDDPLIHDGMSLDDDPLIHDGMSLDDDPLILTIFVLRMIEQFCSEFAFVLQVASG